MQKTTIPKHVTEAEDAYEAVADLLNNAVDGGNPLSPEARKHLALLIIANEFDLSARTRCHVLSSLCITLAAKEEHVRDYFTADPEYGTQKWVKDFKKENSKKDESLYMIDSDDGLVSSAYFEGEHCVAWTHGETPLKLTRDKAVAIKKSLDSRGIESRLIAQ